VVTDKITSPTAARVRVPRTKSVTTVPVPPASFLDRENVAVFTASRDGVARTHRLRKSTNFPGHISIEDFIIGIGIGIETIRCRALDGEL
jgi:hypothetical protein